MKDSLKKNQIFRIFNLFVFTLFSTGCYSTKNLSGQTFITNFPALGFFSTELSFDSNGSYRKHFAGDMISKKDSGTYQTFQKKIILQYKIPPVDSSFYKNFKDIGITMNIVSFVKKNSMDIERTEFATYYLRKDKIFFSKEMEKSLERLLGTLKKEIHNLWSSLLQ